MNRLTAHVHAVVAITASFALVAAPARAQFQPRPLNDLATGEAYHIEAAAGFWFPTADATVSSQSLGIIGSTIDFKKDLGLQDQRFAELHLELRPARSHKFRFQYIPITYDQSSTLARDIVFNGQRYRQGGSVSSTLDWKAYRAGYEYDFVTVDRGYAGFILDFKYTDVAVNLVSPLVTEFARARAPIPAIGGVGRVYVVPNVSITAEVTGLPEGIVKKLSKNDSGHYIDVGVYGTLNFSSYIGVQAGYRSFDVGYVVKTDSGSFVLRGVFAGVVARY